MSGSKASGTYRLKTNSKVARRQVARGPSAAVYMTAAAAAAAALFFLLWWMLQDEETPWVPAGLAASAVLLVAAAARLLNSKRARIPLVSDRRTSSVYPDRLQRHSNNVMHLTTFHAAALRALQSQAAEADEKDMPDLHHEMYEACCEYLTGAERALHFPGLQPESRTALRLGQERARDLQKHHLLAWARGSARALTREAGQRVRLHEKIEVANRALDCLERAAKAYPEEEDLAGSAHAVSEFITSTRVAHWIERAERAAFKGYHQRAIDCYKDALFYLTRDRPSAGSEAAAERITREIDLLRARLDTVDVVDGNRPDDHQI